MRSVVIYLSSSRGWTIRQCPRLGGKSRFSDDGLRTLKEQEYNGFVSGAKALAFAIHHLMVFQLLFHNCWFSALGLLLLFQCMVQLGSSGLLANQMMLTVIVVFRAWFPAADFKFRALGNKSGSFCEAVNCERSEQEGKFLFAI